MENPKTEMELPMIPMRDEQTQTSPLDMINSTEASSTRKETQSLFESLILSIKIKFFGENSTLSWFTATMIMVSLSYGSAVVILPYTISQLGPIVWVIYTSGIIISMAFCTTLLKDCCVTIMDERKDYAIIRHPYPTIAGKVVSSWFGKIVHVFLYIGLISMSLAFILLGAAVLNDIVALPFTHYNNIRVWVIVVILFTSPLMMVGTYNNLQVPAVIAVTTSTISMICILTLSVIVRYHFGIEIEPFEKTPINPKKNIFIIFGDITFAAAGPALALPNIIVFIKTPSTFHYTIIVSHSIIFFIYVVCATVPYVVFGDEVSPMITETFSNFINTAVEENINICYILLAICQVCMTMHFVLVAVLAMNPVFLSVENYFDIELDFNWRRMLIRGCMLFMMLVFCLSVPFFSPVVSLVGGVPQTLLTIVFPIIIYLSLFTCSPYMKLILGLLMVLAFGLMFGNVVFGMADIVNGVTDSLKLNH